MGRRLSSRKKHGLGERLRQEAIDTWPAYSETLHNRIISAIERRHPKNELATPNRRSADARRRAGWTTAFAAACLAGAIVFGWQSAEREYDQGVEDVFVGAGSQLANDLPPMAATETTMPGSPLIDEWADTSVEELGGLFVSAAVAPQSASLKHDTRLAAETLLERLPIDMEIFAGPEK